MIKFRNIRSNNLIGKFIRLPLSMIPKTLVFPILQGSAKGMKWIVGSGVHGMWLGSYETDKQNYLASLDTKGTTVLDIGANVGFFSVLFSRLVGKHGHVHAFEPLPQNVGFLNQHIDLNQLDNISVHQNAVGKLVGIAKFDRSDSHFKSGLSESGDLDVQVVTLDSLDNLDEPVSLLKIDVEGAEDDVLQGGKYFFQVHHPLILLATHSEEKMNNCKEILDSYDYSLTLMSRDLYGSGCDEWIAISRNHLNS